MNRALRSCIPTLLLSLLLVGPSPAFADDVSTSIQTTIETAVGVVKPALVRIHVVSTRYWDGRELKYESSGSGAIISKEGYVITNHHVAGHATRLVCTMSSREEIPARLIGSDAQTDIAVIQLMPADGREFPVVKFGDSALMKEGDQVLALGSPLALSQSVTLGIVSNMEMIMPQRRFGTFQQDGENVGALVRWITHDAAIYPGNSGGPLVNLYGDIVGINEISVAGIGGAIPGNLARDMAHALIRDGRVKRSWIGFTLRPLLKHGPMDKGVLVTNVFKASPAEKAGIESGDILLSLDGHDIVVQFDEQLPEINRLAAGLPIGKDVDVAVWRDGQTKKLTLSTTEKEDARPKQRELKQWGLTIRDISMVQSQEMKRDNQDGVLITSVRPGGPAGDAKPAISRNDVLVAVNDRSVKNSQELADFTKEIMEGADDPMPVLATFERRTGQYVTVVKVGLKEINDPGLEVKKAWLSVDTQVITRDIAKQMGDDSLKGFRVIRVYEGSTADAAGLEVGDLITAVDGEALTASALEHYEELPTLIRNYRVGTEAELSVIRDGNRQAISVELIRAPKLNREMRKFRDENFEFTVRDVTFFDKADRQWDDEVRGVLVEEVQSGGWAAIGAMNVNDLIMEIAGDPIRTIDDVEAAIHKAVNDQPDAIVVKVLRGIYTVYLELEPRWEET